MIRQHGKLTFLSFLLVVLCGNTFAQKIPVIPLDLDSLITVGYATGSLKTLSGSVEKITENRSYLDDILSYEAIGARSVENQQHRLTASGMDIPVGMKNPTSGNLEVMLNSIVAAQKGHRYIYRGMDVSTSGNPYAHAILRGGVDKYGTCIPNYHYEDCIRLYDLYQKKDLENPAIIVDANHSNSNKKFKEQIRITSEILHSRRYNPALKDMIKGVMIESYLEEGRQDICDHMTYGKSITDPCLGWDDTRDLILKIAEEC